MIIKRIRIKDFGKDDRFEVSFDPQLAVLPAPSAKTILKAIGLVLKSRFPVGEKRIAAAGSEIEAEINLSDKPLLITAAKSSEEAGFVYEVKTADGKRYDDFYGMIHQCAEEENLTCFAYDRNDRYSDRLLHYKDFEKYYARGQFTELTDGIGNTKVFRSCLNKYINTFAAQDFEPDSPRRMIINDTGQFRLKGPPGNDKLSEAEDILFEYLCFLNVNQFWEKVEAIRDFNHVTWPLFIGGLPMFRGKTDDNAYYVEKTLAFNRQVFVCDPVTDAETEGTE